MIRGVMTVNAGKAKLVGGVVDPRLLMMLEHHVR